MIVLGAVLALLGLILLLAVPVARNNCLLWSVPHVLSSVASIRKVAKERRANE